MSREGQDDDLPASINGRGLGARPVPEGGQNSSALSPERECFRKTNVALIDELSLRGASTLSLLRLYFRVGARPFGNVPELLKQVAKNANRTCGGVLMCVGGRSVTTSAVIEQLRHLRSALASTPVIIMSDREEYDEVVVAFREGARGYIPTSLEPRLVVEALRLVLAGGRFCPAKVIMQSRKTIVIIQSRKTVEPETAEPAIVPSPYPDQLPVQNQEQWPKRQLGVMRLLIEGKANKEIAVALTMEESTVKVHVRHIMRRLGVTNRTQAAVAARQLGIPLGLDCALASTLPDRGSLQLPSAGTV